jgi:predicted aspartyl protease
MIQGIFGDKGQLFFDIELIANDGLELPVDVMLDTGFTGFLAINKQDLDGLEWQFIREQEMQIVQAEKFFDIYYGKIFLNEQMYEISVFAGDEIREVLLGSEWLKILPLVANFQHGALTLGE